MAIVDSLMNIVFVVLSKSGRRSKRGGGPKGGAVQKGVL